MLLFLRSVALCALGLLGASPSWAQRLPAGITAVTSVEGIDEYRLRNGLQVLLIRDDSKPTTTVNLTYRVGSRHENYGETGMAHLLEHLLFKGTPTHPNVWAEFEKRGLAANGSTSYDRTNYTARFSANPDNLQWYLGWLADSMVNSTIARKDLDTEMTVVRNELERGENQPGGVLLRETMSAMFKWHNYGKSTIGARSDIENVDIPRLQAFYRLYYQPDNATLIVSGRFETAAVLDRIAATFGKLAKPTRMLPNQYTLEPVQEGERNVTVRRTGGAPILYVGYHMPAGPAPDFAAADVLATILGDTPSGRLHKRLTERQLASSAFSFAWSLAEPSVLFGGAQLGPGQDLEKARAALIQAIESFAAEPVTAEELSRAKAKWAKDWEQTFTNPESIGLALSESVAEGDWRLFFLTRDRVRDLKLADVQRVATSYLVATNRTVGAYLPADTPSLRAPAPQRVDIAQSMKEFKPQAAAPSVAAFDATPANIDARTERFAVNGIRAAVLPKPTRGGAVRVTMTLRLGDEKSLTGAGEIPETVAALLDKGTRTLSREQIQDRLDEIKTDLAIAGSADRVTLSLSTRREHLPAAIALMADLLRHPVFPESALVELKQQAVTAIEQRRKEPSAVAGNALGRWGNPYPRGDVRYVPTFDESIQDVNAVTVEKLRDFHARFYGAQGEFAAVGDFDPATLRSALQSAFGDWQRGLPHARIPQPLVAVPPERLMFETPDKQNAIVLIQQSFAISDRDPDYPALMMANHLLGGGGNSRLWRRIREGEGLSYDVRSGVGWSSFEPNSSWQAHAIYAPAVRAKVEAAVREEVARALKDGFTAQELAEGQRGLLNFRRLSRAQDGNLAGALVNNLYVDRTFAYSEKVDQALASLTLAQVTAALRKYVTPDRFVAAFAGDFKGTQGEGRAQTKAEPRPEAKVEAGTRSNAATTPR